jgi:hypothetical protein
LMSARSETASRSSARSSTARTLAAALTVALASTSTASSYGIARIRHKTVWGLSASSDAASRAVTSGRRSPENTLTCTLPSPACAPWLPAKVVGVAFPSTSTFPFPAGAKGAILARIPVTYHSMPATGHAGADWPLLRPRANLVGRGLCHLSCFRTSRVCATRTEHAEGWSGFARKRWGFWGW